jgi:hypothetical protein
MATYIDREGVVHDTQEPEFAERFEVRELTATNRDPYGEWVIPRSSDGVALDDFDSQEAAQDEADRLASDREEMGESIPALQVCRVRIEALSYSLGARPPCRVKEA